MKIIKLPFVFAFLLLHLWIIQAQSPLDLLPTNEATHVVQNSGDWSNTNTWDTNTLPSDGAKIHIPMGKELTIDGQFSARIKIIRNDGKLIFSPSTNTSLLVETIVQGMMGELEIGTANNPIPPGTTCKITIIDEGDITNLTSPQFEKGLVLMGKTVMYGADKTDWLKVAVNPVQGAQSIRLSSVPAGWEAGDRIAVTGTTSSNTPTGDEVVVIQSISGNTVNLTTPLIKDHSDVPASDLRVHVANLTRNILIESENPQTSSLERGHVMFMHTLNVDMNHVRLSKMGRTRKIVPVDGWILNESPTNDDDMVIQGARTNIRGRYSVHFHRGGVSPNLSPAYVRGCVVEDDPGWGYVNHSSFVHFEDNVSYNILGGAFQTEAGDELGSFKRNIAIRTINPNYPRIPTNFPMDDVLAAPDLRGGEQDFAFQGDAFWIHGGGVSVTGNVASGCSGHGFIYWPEGLREDISLGFLNNFEPENVPNSHLLNSERQEVATGWVPVLEFKDNEAYSAIIGFSSYYLHTQFFGDMMEYSPAYMATIHSTFENFTAWNLYWKGVEVNLSERMTFKNLRLVNDDGHVHSIGVDNSSSDTRDKHIYENAFIEGFSLGMIVPRQGIITIDCGTFSNQTNFRMTNPVQSYRDLLMEGITTESHPSFPTSNYTEIEMLVDFSSPLDKHPLYFMFPDRIVLNYGNYANQRLYFDEQESNFVPILPGYEQSPEGQIVPSQFVNLSNQQLMDSYQMSFGGDILPTNALSDPNIIGGKIGMNDASPQNMPICVGYTAAGRFLKTNNFPEILDCIGTSTNFVDSPLVAYEHSINACTITSTAPEALLPQTCITPHPNPTNGFVNISGITGTCNIDILGTNGHIFQSLSTSESAITVDISALPSGMYLIRVIDPMNNSFCVEKIFKTN
ncbi:MAG: G8 domain-containing protein [Bacteroidota bacterium]